MAKKHVWTKLQEKHLINIAIKHSFSYKITSKDLAQAIINDEEFLLQVSFMTVWGKLQRISKEKGELYEMFNYGADVFNNNFLPTRSHSPPLLDEI